MLSKPLYEPQEASLKYLIPKTIQTQVSRVHVQESETIQTNDPWLYSSGTYWQVRVLKKGDLQTVIKAGRWSSGGTFICSYLRDLCPQADRMWKTVVDAGGIVVITSSFS